MRGTQLRKIGIMGGTFDPIHLGHLLIAQSAAEEFELDEVMFLPTGKSPHKSEKQVTDPDIRCRMVEVAIENNPKFVISRLEADNTEVNYTYLTLQKLKELYPNTEFYFIMGEDSLDDFSIWKEPLQICKLAVILVAVRNVTGNGIEEKIKAACENYQGDFRILCSPNFSVSSSDIRKRIQEGKSVSYMIPDNIETFIRQHSLYME